MEAAPGITIGSVGHTEPICRVSGYLRPLEGNARLIAAAPELLRAISNCLEVVEDTDAAEAARLHQIKQYCRAAIAKATGKQPSPESKATEIVSQKRS